MNSVRLAPLTRPLLTGSAIAVVLLLLLHAGVFTTYQLSLTNAYFIPTETSGNVTLVALDNASFAAYGRTPGVWDRSLYADLVDILAQAGARVIAFDLIFSEPTAQDETLADALAAARQSEARTRIVLAAAGVNLPSSLAGEDNVRSLRFENALLPVPALNDRADYRGFVNVFPDSDSFVRRQPSLINISSDDPSRVDVSFALAAYLAWLRVPSAALPQVVTPQDDQLLVTSDRRLPVDENGLWQQNFFGPASTPQRSTFTIVSLLDVLEGKVDSALFRDQVVLVGILNSTGATDQALVPASAIPMAGVEVQANALETLLQNRLVSQPSRLSETLVIILFAIGATLLYARVGWRGKLLLAFVFVTAYVLLSLLQFALGNQVNNLLYPIMALLIPLFITMGFDITDEITLRIRTEAQNQLLEELNRKTEAEKGLLEELNRKTEAERKTLADLNELKTRMIRMASHDLKNPLGRVFGYAELLLLDDNLSKDQIAFVNNIHQSGEEMNTLITEILNLEQLRSGVLHKEHLPLNRLVREVITRHDPDVYRKSQTLRDETGNIPLIVLVDARQMSQAVSNLIGNAIKYTPDGGTITIRMLTTGSSARLEVVDTGYGIPADAQSKLFTEFYRVRTEATRTIKGTGLGLSLVKQVIDAHDGQVGVTSEEGIGSTFFMEIPLAGEGQGEGV